MYFLGYKKCPPGLHDTREESEPQVQLNNTNIQKNFKVIFIFMDYLFK